MVDLFFVLSGFIIHKAYHERLNSGRQIYSFMRNRFARLYPLHFAMLLVFVAIELLRQGSASLGVQRSNEANAPTIWVFIQHIFMVQAIPPFSNIHSFNNPSWSIGVEFYVYLLFAITVMLAGKRTPWFCLIAFLTALALIAIDLFPNASWFLRGLGGFALGTLVSKICKTFDYKAASGRGVNRWISELILAFIFFVTLNASWLGSRAAGIMIMMLTAAYVFSVIFRDTSTTLGPAARVMQHRHMVWLGTLSFTYYLTHGAVIWFTNNFARFVLKWPESLAFGTYKPQAELLPALALTIATVFLTLLVSHFIKKYYEDPMRAWLRD